MCASERLFDESARREASEPICVGGFFFKPAAHAKFKRQWYKTVLRHGARRFPHFHTTDLVAGFKQYRGMNLEDCVAIFENAVTAVEAHAYAMVGIYFDQAEFEKVADPDWPRWFGSIYTAACSMNLQASGYWLRKWQCPMRVRYTFESGHKFQKEADILLKGIAGNEEACRRFKYGDHGFADKAEECGLQAADLFVWVTTKVSLGKAPPSLHPFMPAIVRLARVSAPRQKVLVFTGKKLERFFNEQVSANPAIVVRFGKKTRTFC